MNYLITTKKCGKLPLKKLGLLEMKTCFVNYSSMEDNIQFVDWITTFSVEYWRNSYEKVNRLHPFYKTWVINIFWNKKKKKKKHLYLHAKIHFMVRSYWLWKNVSYNIQQYLLVQIYKEKASNVIIFYLPESEFRFKLTFHRWLFRYEFKRWDGLFILKVIKNVSSKQCFNNST